MKAEFVEATTGFEPVNRGFADPYSHAQSRSSAPRSATSDGTGRLATADRSAVCRTLHCARRAKPDSCWCRAHWDSLVERVIRGRV